MRRDHPRRAPPAIACAILLLLAVGCDAGDGAGAPPVGPPPRFDVSPPGAPVAARRCDAAARETTSVVSGPLPAPAVDATYDAPFAVDIEADLGPGEGVAFSANVGNYTLGNRT